MNIELVSNTKPKYREKNFTNDFEIPLQEPIDGTQGKTFEITEFTYPLTTKNILKDECSFQLKVTFRDVRKITPDVDGDAFRRLKHALNQVSDLHGQPIVLPKPSAGEVTMTMDKVTLPSGSYDLTHVLNIMNRHMSPNGVSVELNRAKRVKFYFDSIVGYYFMTNRAPIIKKYVHADHLHRHTEIYRGKEVSESDGYKDLMNQGLCTTYDGGTLGEYRLSNTPRTISYEITFSKKLAFILGFESCTIMKDVDGVKHRSNNEMLHTIVGDYIPNINASNDRLFVYCEEIEAEIVGNVKTNIMLCVPRYTQNHGDGGVAIYTPPKTIRRLKRKRIDDFNITVRDSAGELIEFDSGTVIIKGILN